MPAHPLIDGARANAASNARTRLTGAGRVRRESIGWLALCAFFVIVAGVAHEVRGETVRDTIDRTHEIATWEGVSGGLLIGPAAAEEARARGAALVDARATDRFEASHLRGAVNIPWQDLTDGPHDGAITNDDARLTAYLQRRGISAAVPVIVYGDWSTGEPHDSWGEEGRAFWALEYLGHRDVRVLIGGIDEATRAGWELDAGLGVAPPAGDFVVERRPDVRATTAVVAQLVARDDRTTIILDTREAAEFHGAVRYGESRGGRIPGASHLWWYDLFDDRGYLHSPETLVAMLRERGFTDGDHVVAYCTGGVRSGFAYLILRALGVPASNYDASMWAWTANDELPVD